MNPFLILGLCGLSVFASVILVGGIFHALSGDHPLEIVYPFGTIGLYVAIVLVPIGVVLQVAA